MWPLLHYNVDVITLAQQKLVAHKDCPYNDVSHKCNTFSAFLVAWRAENDTHFEILLSRILPTHIAVLWVMMVRCHFYCYYLDWGSQWCNATRRIVWYSHKMGGRKRQPVLSASQHLNNHKQSAHNKMVKSGCCIPQRYMCRNISTRHANTRYRRY